MYQQLIPIIAPVLICALLGYAWSRSNWPFDREFLTRIIMNIGAPCLILKGMTELQFETADFALMLLAGLTVLGICAGFGAIALLLTRQPLRSFLPPVIFGNAGNLGLPLCLFAFGTEGLGLAVAIYLIGSVSQFILGPLFQGHQSAWETVIKTPIIYAAATGIFLLATDTALPEFLGNTVDLLAGLAIPLMLLALGYSLGHFKITRPGVAFGVALFRLGLGFAVGVAVVELYQLTGTMRGVVIIESSMPVAVFNYLLAARYQRHPEDVAGAIVISTVISFITLPPLILFALGSN